MITGIFGPNSNDLVDLNSIRQANIKLAYDSIGVVACADVYPDGSQFVNNLIDACRKHKVTHIIFYAHPEKGEDSWKAAIENIVAISELVIIFQRPGDRYALYLLARCRVKGVETRVIPIGT